MNLSNLKTDKNTRREVITYLIVGIWNTIFGLSLYTALILILGESHYLLLGFFCNILTITNAYICYKLFVFKTKGNILREYLKCYLVYGTSMVIGLILMYCFVDIFKISAIISNFIITICLCTVSFIGHKFFSFQKREN